ncbi:TetR/AcrR family transcriptional regulator [Pseudarthrobacter sp. Fe7]|nr:TetR/AcrR family transcriptional regulator [Pseudarthrobacter sp. Fe7]
MYYSGMPKLWNETIETHRDAVRRAVLDAAARLVAGHGLAGVTMSAVAQNAGIGRATLYKYFPDVESILAAWHERQIESHLTELTRVRDRTEGAWEQARGGAAGLRVPFPPR